MLDVDMSRRAFVAGLAALPMVRVGRQLMIDGNDPMWGLVGNGSTDNSPMVQALVDSAITNNEAVKFPPGTFRLNTKVVAAKSVTLDGDGPERTVFTPPADDSAFAIGSLDQTGDQGLRISNMTFRHNSPANTSQPILDIIQFGRKWKISDVNFDGAAGSTGPYFSNRPCIRLYTSWVGSINDCNFWRFGTEGSATAPAAIIVKPHKLGNGNGPINNVAINDCAFERVQVGIDLHDPADLANSSVIHAVHVKNPRFKNTSINGYMKNSVGIRANSSATMNVVVTAPFFEDFETGIDVQGWGWTITSPFCQSARELVRIGKGGGHCIDNMILYGSANNAIGAGVRGTPEMNGRCDVRRWFSPTGGTYLLEDGVVDETTDSYGTFSVSRAR